MLAEHYMKNYEIRCTEHDVEFLTEEQLLTQLETKWGNKKEHLAAIRI